MLAPLLLMISGIRKPPPISTASPLDTMTSFPFDMAARDLEEQEEELGYYE